MCTDEFHFIAGYWCRMISYALLSCALAVTMVTSYVEDEWDRCNTGRCECHRFWSRVFCNDTSIEDVVHFQFFPSVWWLIWAMQLHPLCTLCNFLFCALSSFVCFVQLLVLQLHLLCTFCNFLFCVLLSFLCFV